MSKFFARLLGTISVEEYGELRQQFQETRQRLTDLQEAQRRVAIDRASVLPGMSGIPVRRHDGYRESQTHPHLSDHERHERHLQGRIAALRQALDDISTGNAHGGAVPDAILRTAAEALARDNEARKKDR